MTATLAATRSFRSPEQVREGKFRPIGPGGVRTPLVGPVSGPIRPRLAALLVAGDLDGSIALIAYALPEREAVWWASMCVRSTVFATASGQEQALQAAETWVRAPRPEARDACLASVRSAGDDTPAAFVARGAFAARLGDPLSPRAGRRVRQAVIRLVAALAPDAREAAARRFVASAEDIASGGAGRQVATGHAA